MARQAAKRRQPVEQRPEAHVRRWTQVGAAGAGAHVFYELACGVAMPYASRLGPVPAALAFGAGTLAVFRQAGRQPHSRDPFFAAINGVFLSIVLAHFSSWPKTKVAGLPWLTECEGLSGRLMPPYNLILHTCGAAALAGLVENRRGCVWGLVVPVLLVPWLKGEQHREYQRLLAQALQRPRWWNRRLAL
jgi:hypothetical protein